MDIKTDFSNCIFILTANSVMQMLEPLKNRLEMIKVDSYIEEEKMEIANKYLLPEIIDTLNVTKDIVIMNEMTIRLIIKGWCCYEGGVRFISFYIFIRNHGQLPEPILDLRSFTFEIRVVTHQ